MGYSIETNVNSCYPGTTCLINKLDIRDDKKLAVLEADITFAKAAVLESQAVKLPLDFEYYKSIHRFLFEDLYEWAGNLRNVNISKKGTRFCPVENLEELCEKYFKRLQNMNYLYGLSKNEFIEELIDLYCTTNYLHPFREGNGRTQRIFISKLIRYNNYSFDFSNIDPDLLMIATIQASNGITNNLYHIFETKIK